MSIVSKRKSKGYSQLEISKKLGIPLRTYKRYELTEETNHTYKHDLIESQIQNLPKNIIRTNIKKEKIVILGAGNVGYALGILLSYRNKVIFLDNNDDKLNKINSGISLSDEPEIKNVIKKMNASSDIRNLNYCDSVIIALPTNFNNDIGQLDTSLIEQYVDYINKNNQNATVVIKSTVPIGFTSQLVKKYKDLEIIYSPVFLREGYSMVDSQYPDRMIFGVKRKNLKNKRMALVLENITDNASKTMFMSYEEAEAVKLFSNTYLAMRIAYMNEIDSFALTNNLNAQNIIEGVCKDNRIGNFYNNPSFGFGGHCLPKDAKQLSNSLGNSTLVNTVSVSNEERSNLIVKQIMKRCDKHSIIGFYKTSNKDSSRKIAEILKEKNYQVIFFEEGDLEFEKFAKTSTLIVANRIDERISVYKEKVFSRDLFQY